MQRIVSKSLSCYTLSLQPFHSHFNPSAISSNSSFFLFKNFSNKTNSPSETTDSVAPTIQETESHAREKDDDDDVSNEELKKRIAKFYEGDGDAIPSIFEAILKRKLAGKHDESDDELLEQFGSKSRDDKDFDSD